MIKQLVKEFCETTSVSNLEEDLVDFLTTNNKLRWLIFREMEKELHKEDVENELTNMACNDEEFDKIDDVLTRYENNLANSDDWYLCLIEALHNICGI